MAIHLSKFQSLLKSSVLRHKGHYPIASYTLSKRWVQEFPGLKLRNAPQNDYVIVLPELLDEKPDSNEALRLPKVGEPEIDFQKLNAESLYKGLSQTVCSFENFVTDYQNNVDSNKLSVRQFFKDIERNLYPMDNAYNILMALLRVDPQKYAYEEIYDLIRRNHDTRDKRLEECFKETVQNYVFQEYDTLPPIERKMLELYYPRNINKRTALSSLDEVMVNQYSQQLRLDSARFRRNLSEANRYFSYTVDDPDILAAVATEFDDCQDFHHKERTPLNITNTTYRRFMQVCPDRFVRHLLWQTRNKRCSPKALPKNNNVAIINNMRVLRRKIANLSGYKNHVELKMANAMANSKAEVLSNLESLNQENGPKLNDRLQELNDFAADNSFEGAGESEIQEYDVDFWTHKYMHEILIGKSESEIKTYFPLPVVLDGIKSYLSNYFGIELKAIQDRSRLWDKHAQMFEVSRKNQPLGFLVLDLYQRNGKNPEHIYARLRGRNKDLNCLPMRLISHSYKPDPATKEAQLSMTEIMNLFYAYGTVIQRLLYNFDYYELNAYGGFETDTNNLLPHLCVAHLLNDHRILQSCSDRGGSKPIDAELASRILRANTHFNPFRTWRRLYRAHLDLEVYSVTDDTRSLVQNIYSLYSPFSRDLDNYDFCVMLNTFVGPNDGSLYSDLWSKQLANLCLKESLASSGSADMSNDVKPIRDFNDKLLNTLFDPEKFDTREKLSSLLGRAFEPSKASLGVF